MSYDKTIGVLRGMLFEWKTNYEQSHTNTEHEIAGSRVAALSAAIATLESQSESADAAKFQQTVEALLEKHEQVTISVDSGSYGTFMLGLGFVREGEYGYAEGHYFYAETVLELFKKAAKAMENES